MINKHLPGLPPFECQKLVIGNEDLQFFRCDTLECISSLFGNPEFSHGLVFAPERHYTCAERKCHILNEMHTGDWWWNTQVRKIDLN